MRKILEWFGIRQKMTVIVTCRIGEVYTTIEATAWDVETISDLLKVANGIIGEQQK